jgi:hypothetical protein
MINKEYISLKLRNKARLLNSALRISKCSDVDSFKKSKYVRYLIDGGDFFQLLFIIKNKKELNELNLKNIEVDLSGSIELIDKQHVFHANGRNKLLARVHNLSTFTWITKADFPLFLSYHWYHMNGDLYIQDGKRTRFNKELEIGDDGIFELDILSPVDTGSYQLELTMVLEDISWAEERNFVTCTEKFEVLEYDGGDLNRHAAQIFEKLNKLVLMKEGA